MLLKVVTVTMRFAWLTCHGRNSPANILLSLDDRPVIVDFGFANRWSLRPEHSGSAFMSKLAW